MYFDEVILDDLDDELDIERNTMKFITDKEYKDIVSWTLENKSEDSEDYKKLVHATQLLKNIRNGIRTIWKESIGLCLITKIIKLILT